MFILFRYGALHYSGSRMADQYKISELGERKGKRETGQQVTKKLTSSIAYQHQSFGAYINLTWIWRYFYIVGGGGCINAAACHAGARVLPPALAWCSPYTLSCDLNQQAKNFFLCVELQHVGQCRITTPV